jgi:hypothetical protein
LLLEAVGLYEAQGKGRFVDWGKVVVFLKERGYVRSYEQCKQKWNKTLKPKLGGEVNCEPWKADEVTLFIIVIIIWHMKNKIFIEYNRILNLLLP